MGKVKLLPTLLIALGLSDNSFLEDKLFVRSRIGIRYTVVTNMPDGA